MLAITGVTPIISGLLLDVTYYMVLTYFLLIPAILAIIVNLELEMRRRNMLFRSQQEDERRLYLTKVLEAQDQERKRIAHEIHDEPIQTLLAVASYADIVQSTNSEVNEKEEAGALIRKMTLETIDNLRNLTLNLRPRLLDEIGLVPALNWLVNNMNSESNIHYRLMVGGKEQKLPSQMETPIFRVIQEALNNIKKHSKANEANIDVDFTDQSLNILIIDNGQGFLPTSVHERLILNNKMGLIGMQERVESLRGTFKIHSELNVGTNISIQIPY